MYRSAAILMLSIAVLVTVDKHGVADEPLPRSLLKLLQPDMRVGIQWIQGTAAVELNVYSEEQFRIAQEPRSLTLNQLKEKYVAVEKQAQEVLQRFPAIQSDKELDETVRIKPRVLMRRKNERLGIIKHVGDDYILLTFGGPKERRQALASRFVARVNLDAFGVELHTFDPAESRSTRGR